MVSLWQLNRKHVCVCVVCTVQCVWCECVCASDSRVVPFEARGAGAARVHAAALRGLVAERRRVTCAVLGIRDHWDWVLTRTTSCESGTDRRPWVTVEWGPLLVEPVDNKDKEFKTKDRR